ncbi:hypothetical protein [Mycobacterium intracellulare]|uniref:hypothetical protein n=1 Tax=Mycobacterium intracellulare TaxID=1767 RepID=UPI001E42148B|nr:hypothetical protein [Mycobacterium intracellulare]
MPARPRCAGSPQRHRLARGRGLQDEVTDHLWSIARRAAQDAGRDPDALKRPCGSPRTGTSVDFVADKLERLAESGADEAIVDAFAMFPTLEELLDFAGQVIARTTRKLDDKVAVSRVINR